MEYKNLSHYLFNHLDDTLSKIFYKVQEEFNSISYRTQHQQYFLPNDPIFEYFQFLHDSGYSKQTLVNALQRKHFNLDFISLLFSFEKFFLPSRQSLQTFFQKEISNDPKLYYECFSYVLNKHNFEANGYYLQNKEYFDKSLEDFHFLLTLGLENNLLPQPEMSQIPQLSLISKNTAFMKILEEKKLLNQKEHLFDLNDLEQILIKDVLANHSQRNKNFDSSSTYCKVHSEKILEHFSNYSQLEKFIEKINNELEKNHTQNNPKTKEFPKLTPFLIRTIFIPSNLTQIEDNHQSLIKSWIKNTSFLSQFVSNREMNHFLPLFPKLPYWLIQNDEINKEFFSIVNEQDRQKHYYSSDFYISDRSYDSFLSNYLGSLKINDYSEEEWNYILNINFQNLQDLFSQKYDEPNKYLFLSMCAHYLLFLSKEKNVSLSDQSLSILNQNQQILNLLFSPDNRSFEKNIDYAQGFIHFFQNNTNPLAQSFYDSALEFVKKSFFINPTQQNYSNKPTEMLLKLLSYNWFPDLIDLPEFWNSTGSIFNRDKPKKEIYDAPIIFLHLSKNVNQIPNFLAPNYIEKLNELSHDNKDFFQFIIKHSDTNQKSNLFPMIESIFHHHPEKAYQLIKPSSRQKKLNSINPQFNNLLEKIKQFEQLSKKVIKKSVNNTSITPANKI